MPREAGSGGAAIDQHRPIAGFARLEDQRPAQRSLPAPTKVLGGRLAHHAPPTNEPNYVDPWGRSVIVTNKSASASRRSGQWQPVGEARGRKKRTGRRQP